MYLPHEIEPKWQKKWMETGIYNASDTSKAQKSYILVEFPYPSGERLHVGHARSYCSIDAVARLKRMQGFNVMYPFGWDAFGLPAENYAIKTGIHPSITVAENIKKSKAQVISWGLSFDWDREISTTDPHYYKWTQWIFLQLYNAGLAYRDEIAVNWCPSCKTNLANEEVVAGKCERCGHVTKRRTQKQWLLKITAYSERLLDDLTTVDYRNDIKIQQINWIGRKEGVSIDYPVIDSDEVLTCFTTRPDTNFGASFIALAPEHRLAKLISDVDHKVEVKKYIEISIKKSELERQEGKIKTGVFTGRYVLNRLNNEKLPIYIADYVLHSVGTSAIVGVPAHDIRDFEFANKFKLNAKRVVLEKGNTDLNNVTNTDEVYEGEGTIVNSGFLNDLDSEQGLQVVIDFLEKNGFGKRSTTYHLRDWVFSRQHYWGEPIPVVYCEKCGIVTIPEKDLPVVLPYLENYKPSETGESPLSSAKDWLDTKCPHCGGKARRETDTMPNWAGSSWYFLRYIDPNNDNTFADFNKLQKWMPIDWYNGGMEHTTLHLLYSRFWYKFLFDKKLVPNIEPYAKRTSHGVVLGPNGKKMSKSKGNVINPDDIVLSYGADSLRLYLMFSGPFELNVSWSNEAIMGVRRFLNRVWDISTKVIESGRITSADDILRLINVGIKRSEEDILGTKFNTYVSGLMEIVNFLIENESKVGIDAIKLLVLILAPGAPHISEEMWSLLGEEYSVHRSKWPKYDINYDLATDFNIVVQVDGKFKGTISCTNSEVGDEVTLVKKILFALNMREKYNVSEENRRIIVKNKLINFITR